MTELRITTPLQDCGLRGKELWDRVTKEIDADPELWYQDQWASREITNAEHLQYLDMMMRTHVVTPILVEPCGTAKCAAGWATSLCGEPAQFGLGMTSSSVTVGGQLIYNRARELLQITRDQADALFDGQNSREDLDGIAARIWPTS